MRDGGPAFPHLLDSCQRANETEMHPGMTLRDYFAAAALTGLLSELAHPDTTDSAVDWSVCAKSAYTAADAMLAARAAKAPEPARGEAGKS